MAPNAITPRNSSLLLEKGSTAIEYTLILAAILLVAIPSFSYISICAPDNFLKTGYAIGGSEGTPPFAC